ncbi:MAG: hypothetical protein QXO47_03525 [Thermoproteota archaeon]|nr:hypothetical protein [Candidatus Brockarchaeota archaeon]
MDPRVKKRLLDSIEYLRKLDFFQDYLNLSAGKILERILNGDIDYEPQWFLEEIKEKKGEEYFKKYFRTKPYGEILKESLEKNEEEWMRASDFNVDFELASFDKKRILIENPETDPSKDMGIYLMRRLARISRGLLIPEDIREEWSEGRGKTPSDLKKYLYDDSCEYWCRVSVSFKFEGKMCSVDFYCKDDYLILEPTVKKINELIRDTGYQYYWLPGDDFCFVVLTQDEAEKLKREREWKFVKWRS